MGCDKLQVFHTSVQADVRGRRQVLPAAPINDLHDITTDPGFVEDREMLVHLPHPVIGEDMLVNGNPVKLMGTPVEIKRHAPLTPGVDNEEVYKGVFGLTDAQLADLKAKGAI